MAVKTEPYLAPSNKALHLTPVNVAKIHRSKRLSRVVEVILASLAAAQLERCAASYYVSCPCRTNKRTGIISNGYATKLGPHSVAG